MKSKKLVLALSIAAIALTPLSFLLYKTINKDDDVERTQSFEQSELGRFLKLEEEYQAKITGFNPENYKLPKANPSIANEVGGCKNGFGGSLPKIHKGMFDEALYSFNAEKVKTDIEDQFGYSPYVNSFVLVGDILFKQPLDLFDRKLITSESLFRNFSDLRVVIGNKSYKNSYSTMESKFGFPQSYVQQQAGNVVSFSAFNDQCDKGIAPYNITFKKFDLSRLPIASILSANYQTSLYHGANGLYNHTSKSTDFVSETFLEWVQSNNRAYLDILKNKNDYLFPDGAYVYFPVKYNNKREVVTVDFKAEPLNLTLNQLKAKFSKEYSVPLNEIFIVEEKLGDFKVLKFVKSLSLEKFTDVAIAQKDDKFYLAKWDMPIDYEIAGTEFERSKLVLFNQTAMGAALNIFKAKYQGKQLDIGTENEQLEEKYLELSSPDAQAELERKKEEILKTMNMVKERSSNKIEDNTIPMK